MENTETNSGAASSQASQRDYPLIDAMCLGVKNILRSIEPPSDVTQHFRNARIEVLRGVRSMIDHRIENLTRAGDPGREITVE
jgi:hypothetical protein